VQEMGVFQVRLGSYLLVTVPIYFQIIPPGPVFVENVGVHMRLPGCYGTIHKNVKGEPAYIALEFCCIYAYNGISSMTTIFC